MARTPYRRPDAFHYIPSGVRIVGASGGGSGITNKVFQADAIELVQSLPDRCVDLVVTDPAYESLERWRATGTTTRLKKSKGSSNEWFKTFPNVKYHDLFRELYRVLKPGSHLYMFCDEETRDIVTIGFSPQSGAGFSNDISNYASPLLAPGFKYWKSIIWDKVVGGMGYHYRAAHELIVFAEKVRAKGKHRRLNDSKPMDVLHFQRLKGKNYYPTEKPFDLIELLILQSTNEGDVVLDPFCGSGVVGQVCQKHNRQYILGDIKPEEAVRRLQT